MAEITINDLARINKVLAKGDRVEITPVKDGVRIHRIERTEIKK